MIKTTDSIDGHLKETRAGDLADLETLINNTLQATARAGRKVSVIDTAHVRDEVVMDVLPKLKEAGWRSEFKPETHELRIYR